MSVSTMTLSAEQANAGLAALESTLQFVLEGASVPLLAQQIVGHLGYRSLALFSRSAGSETEFRQFIKDDMLIDPSTGGQARLASAALLVAWEASRKRVEKRMDEEATQRSSDGLPRPLLKRDFLESRRAYESFRRSTDPDFVLEDKNMPSKGYLELLLERVEDGDLRPETLAEVLTADRDTDDPCGGRSYRFRRPNASAKDASLGHATSGPRGVAAPLPHYGDSLAVHLLPSAPRRLLEGLLRARVRPPPGVSLGGPGPRLRVRVGRRPTPSV